MAANVGAGAKPAQAPRLLYEVRLHGEVVSRHTDLLVALPASRRPGAGAELYRIADDVLLAKTHSTCLSPEEKLARKAIHERRTRRGAKERR